MSNYTSRTAMTDPTSRITMTDPTSGTGMQSSYYVGDETSQAPSRGASRASVRTTPHSRIHLSSTSPGIKPESPHESPWKKVLLTVISVFLGVASIALSVYFIQQMTESTDPGVSQIDHCQDNPCQNGGKCVNGVDGFTCVCEACFTGRLCGTDNFTPSGKRGSSAYCTSKQNYPTNIMSLNEKCKELLPHGYLAELNDEAEFNFLLESLKETDDDKKRHSAMLGARCEKNCIYPEPDPESVWRFINSRQIVGNWQKKIKTHNQGNCMWIVWNAKDDAGLHHFYCQANKWLHDNRIVCEVDTDKITTPAGLTTTTPTPTTDGLKRPQLVGYVLGMFTLWVCFSAIVYYTKQKYYSTSMRATGLHNETINIETTNDTQSRASRVPSRLSSATSRNSRILEHPASSVDQLSYPQTGSKSRSHLDTDIQTGSMSRSRLDTDRQTGSMSRSRLDTDMQTGGLSHSRLAVPQSSKSRSRTSNSRLLASQSKSRSRTLNSGLSTIQQSRSQISDSNQLDPGRSQSQY